MPSALVVGTAGRRVIAAGIDAGPVRRLVRVMLNDALRPPFFPPPPKFVGFPEKKPFSPPPPFSPATLRPGVRQALPPALRLNLRDAGPLHLSEGVRPWPGPRL